MSPEYKKEIIPNILLQVPPEKKHLLASLTPHQQAILEMVAQGYSDKEIAEKMTLAPGTVRQHTARIYRAIEASPPKPHKPAQSERYRRILEHLGIPTQPPNIQAPQLTKHEALITTLTKAGFDPKLIASTLGVKRPSLQTQISEIRKKAPGEIPYIRKLKK